MSIENPKNSFFWEVDEVAQLLREHNQQFFAYFHHCMHGGKRDKLTAWWSANPRNPGTNMFASLELMCDNQHHHAPWRPYRGPDGTTIFPTKEEAAHPLLLCQRVACILKQHALQAGSIFPTDLEEQINAVAGRQLFTAQPRGQRLRPLVSEYGSYAQLVVSAGQPNNEEALLKQLPKGSKICHRSVFLKGVERDDMLKKFERVNFSNDWKALQPCEVLHVGIPREPADFIAEAVRKSHPCDIICTGSGRGQNCCAQHAER